MTARTCQRIEIINLAPTPSAPYVAPSAPLTIPDVPGTVAMSSRVATIGRLQLRCLLRTIVVPGETYAALTELADALAEWEEGK